MWIPVNSRHRNMGKENDTRNTNGRCSIGQTAVKPIDRRKIQS
jgi:hypothetical protein